jgi:hypothetical protein
MIHISECFFCQICYKWFAVNDLCHEEICEECLKEYTGENNA